MNIDIDEVLKTSAAIRSQIENGSSHQSLLHIDAVTIAARIHAIIEFQPMSQADLCYYFRTRGFGNTVMIEYMLNRFCRRVTRNYLWDRDEFGRFSPAHSYMQH